MNIADKIIYFFRETQRVLIGFVDALDQTFISTVTRLAPIVAPAPAAYSVYRAMISPAIAAPWEMAILTAVAVELIGMFQAKTALRSRNWNLIRLNTEPPAPFGLAVVMAVIYFIVALSLTLAIELAPQVALFIFPSFVIFSGSVYISSAIAWDLTRWEASRDDRLRGQQTRSNLTADIKKLTGQINQARLTLAGLTGQINQATSPPPPAPPLLRGVRGVGDWGVEVAQTDPLDPANQARQDNITGRRLRLIDLLRSDPNLTNPQLAEILAVSLSTVKADKKALNGQLTGQRE